MPSVNKCIFIGNVTRPIEPRQTPSGAVADIGLAINRTYKTKTGDKKDEVTWITCVAWGQQAETIAKYVAKGDPLYVETRATNDEWLDKEGNKRSATRFIISEFQFLPRTRAAGNPGGEPSQEAANL